jgi:hypothetical protein
MASNTSKPAGVGSTRAYLLERNHQWCVWLSRPPHAERSGQGPGTKFSVSVPPYRTEYQKVPGHTPEGLSAAYSARPARAAESGMMSWELPQSPRAETIHKNGRRAKPTPPLEPIIGWQDLVTRSRLRHYCLHWHSRQSHRWTGHHR